MQTAVCEERRCERSKGVATATLNLETASKAVTTRNSSRQSNESECRGDKPWRVNIAANEYKQDDKLIPKYRGLSIKSDQSQARGRVREPTRRRGHEKRFCTGRYVNATPKM